MKSCPFCNSEYTQKNDGKGVYNQCISCGSKVYNFPLLKRSGFDSQLFTKFLSQAKENSTSVHGSCISCENPYKKVDYELNGYKTTACVCPTCLEFAIQKRDLSIFEEAPQKKETPKRTGKTLSPEAEKLMNELDEKITYNKKSWEGFDQAVKVSKSKLIGFFFFLFILIIVFVKLGFRNANTSFGGTIFFISLFLIIMFVGFFLIIGRKGLFRTAKKYFNPNGDI